MHQTKVTTNAEHVGETPGPCVTAPERTVLATARRHGPPEAQPHADHLCRAPVTPWANSAVQTAKCRLPNAEGAFVVSGAGGGADGRCNYSVNPELFIPLFGAVLC